MLLFSIFSLIFIWKIGEATLSPTCIGATLQYAVKDWGTEITVFKAGFNLNIEMDYSNATYPNKLTMSNFSYWSQDYSLYNLTNPMFYTQYAGYRYGCCPNIGDKSCSFINDCSFYVPNGNGYFILDMRTNGSNWAAGDNIEFFVDNGNMFDSDSAKLFNPKNYPCNIDNDGSSFCCNKYLNFNISENNENQCQEFETSAKVVVNDTGLTIFKFNANHVLNLNNFDTTVTEFINNVDFYGYTYYSNNVYSRVYNGTFCSGDNDSPYSNCTFIFPSNYDFQSDMIIDMGYYDYIIIGQLIRRNGMYFKNDNISFTPMDPCWNTVTPVPYGYQVEKSSVVQASLCCTRFKYGSTIIYPSVSPSPTPSNAYCNVSNVIFAGEMSKSITSQQKLDFYNVILRLTQSLKNSENLKYAITTYATQIYPLITFQNYPDFINTVDNLISDLPNPDGSKTYLESILRDIYNVILLDPKKKNTAVLLMGELQNIMDPNAAIKVAQKLKGTGASIYVIDYSAGGVPTTIWQYITNNMPNRIINGTGQSSMSIAGSLESFTSNIRNGYC
uniref:VWFA domain-containing protein n=1 Tax=Panagrolaimus sp. ES5 TaxID=591445 RepID=A0AC34F4S4_9BILA